MAGLRNALRHLGDTRGEWAGIPMPMEGCNLIVEPTYPRARELMNLNEPDEGDAEITSLSSVRNTFWSWHHRRWVVIWNGAERIEWGLGPSPAPVQLLLKTLNAADAWGIEQESRAIDTLATLLRHRQFKQYLLTGMFMEMSARSGVHYLFRRLRPTLALSTSTGTIRFLAALCLHPIAYYEGSWAGAMAPTDDVIAHLMLMRGDEHLLWRRANQHPSWEVGAGLS